MTLLGYEGTLDCPSCGNTEFYEGPHGGCSINVKCANCGKKFNFMGPFGMQPIDNEDRFYGQTACGLSELWLSNL